LLARKACRRFLSFALIPKSLLSKAYCSRKTAPSVQRLHHLPLFVASPRAPLDYSPQRIDRKRDAAAALTKRGGRPFTGCDRRSLIRERTGNAVRNECSKAAAAPATVGGEPVPNCHWGDPREGGDGRRAASQETCRRFGRGPGGVPRGRSLRIKHPDCGERPAERHA
jgi:hypothetical protein